LQKEIEEAKQRCDDLDREKLRVERQMEDTSAQVINLCLATFLDVEDSLIVE